MVSWTGSCLCGAVRYEVRGDPVHTFYCHCTDCQKETGGPFATEIYVARDAVAIHGELSEYSVIGDSGKPVIRTFCPTCGCPIVTRFEVEPGFVCIKACSVDESHRLRPEFHLYVKSKQPWYVLADGLPQYPGDMEW